MKSTIILMSLGVGIILLAASSSEVALPERMERQHLQNLIEKIRSSEMNESQTTGAICSTFEKV